MATKKNTQNKINIFGITDVVRTDAVNELINQVEIPNKYLLTYDKKNPTKQPIVFTTEMPLDIITIDKRYQIEARQKRNAKLAENFELYKLDPVLLSLRADGTIVAIDGWHRIRAAKKNEYTTLPARILVDLKYTDEARLFAEQQDNTNKITPPERFISMVQSGAPLYVAANKVITSYNYKIKGNKGTSPRDFTCIGNVNALIRQYKAAGIEFLEWVLSLFAKSNWNQQNDHATATLLLAFRHVYFDGDTKALPNKSGAASTTKKEAFDNLCTVMRVFSPDMLMTYSKFKNPEKDKRNAIKVVLAQIAEGEINAVTITSDLIARSED